MQLVPHYLWVDCPDGPAQSVSRSLANDRFVYEQIPGVHTSTLRCRNAVSQTEVEGPSHAGSPSRQEASRDAACVGSCEAIASTCEDAIRSCYAAETRRTFRPRQRPPPLGGRHRLQTGNPMAQTTRPQGSVMLTATYRTQDGHLPLQPAARHTHRTPPGISMIGQSVRLHSRNAYATHSEHERHEGYAPSGGPMLPLISVGGCGANVGYGGWGHKRAIRICGSTAAAACLGLRAALRRDHVARGERFEQHHHGAHVVCRSHALVREVLIRSTASACFSGIASAKNLI